MNIIVSERRNRWIAEVFHSPNTAESTDDAVDFYPMVCDEATYLKINDWCIANFGYPARSSFHMFEFKKKSELDWFLLKWN